jgi:hypothetical protein
MTSRVGTGVGRSGTGARAVKAMSAATTSPVNGQTRYDG